VEYKPRRRMRRGRRKRGDSANSSDGEAMNRLCPVLEANDNAHVVDKSDISCTVAENGNS
jgi:hypothetical protein